MSEVDLGRLVDIAVCLFFGWCFFATRAVAAKQQSSVGGRWTSTAYNHYNWVVALMGRLTRQIGVLRHSFSGRREQTVMLKVGEVLDQHYLDARCMLLEIAATLDRLDAAAERESCALPREDRRLRDIYQSLELLADPQTTPDRAERLLNLFSDLD